MINIQHNTYVAVFTNYSVYVYIPSNDKVMSSNSRLFKTSTIE